MSQLPRPRTSRRALLAALIGLSALGAAVPASAEVKPQKKWIGLNTPAFRVLGDVGERDLREVAQRLEQFREAVGILLPKAVSATSTPTTVLVFRSHRNYEPFKPLYEGKPAPVAGYFLPGPTINYITLTTEGGSDNIRIIYHEYVHLLVNNTSSGVPVWFNEGIAEYYRSFELEGGGKRASVGGIHSDHILELRQRFIPLETLVAVEHGSPLYNERDRSSVFYAEAWALVHYLQLGDDRRFAPKFAPFLAALSNGVPLEQACQQALGVSARELQGRLRSYVQQDRFFKQQVTFSERIGRLDQLAATPVPEAEVHAVLGDLLLHMGRDAEARAQLDHALAVDPDSTAAHAALGLLYARAGRLDEARPHLKRAVDGRGATFLTSYYYAWALDRAKGGGPDEDAEIERALRRSIELNPDFAEAHAQLAWRRAQAGALDEAATLARRAIALTPGREDYILMFASILTLKREYGDARIVLDHLVRTAADERIRNDARQQLEQLARFEERRQETGSGNGGFDATDRPAPGPPMTSSGFVPILRSLKEGENRIAARLRAIECEPNGIALVLEQDGGAEIRLRAPRFEEVEFIAYRDDLSGQITCGERKPPDFVYVTYRPDAAQGGAGLLVAVEFLPEAFAP